MHTTCSLLLVGNKSVYKGRLTPHFAVLFSYFCASAALGMVIGEFMEVDVWNDTILCETESYHLFLKLGS
jgi:hypothetical protein